MPASNEDVITRWKYGYDYHNQSGTLRCTRDGFLYSGNRKIGLSLIDGEGRRDNVYIVLNLAGKYGATTTNHIKGINFGVYTKLVEPVKIGDEWDWPEIQTLDDNDITVFPTRGFYFGGVKELKDLPKITYIILDAHDFP